MVKYFFTRLIFHWRRLGLWIASLVNIVLLAIIYIGLIVPIGFMWKLIKKDPMKKAGLNENSYFVESVPTDDSHWERMF